MNKLGNRSVGLSTMVVWVSLAVFPTCYLTQENCLWWEFALVIIRGLPVIFWKFSWIVGEHKGGHSDPQKVGGEIKMLEESNVICTVAESSYMSRQLFMW